MYCNGDHGENGSIKYRARNKGLHILLSNSQAAKTTRTLCVEL